MENRTKPAPHDPRAPSFAGGAEIAPAEVSKDNF